MLGYMTELINKGLINKILFIICVICPSSIERNNTGFWRGVFFWSKNVYLLIHKAQFVLMTLLKEI